MVDAKKKVVDKKDDGLNKDGNVKGKALTPEEYRVSVARNRK